MYCRVNVVGGIRIAVASAILASASFWASAAAGQGPPESRLPPSTAGCAEPAAPAAGLPRLGADTCIVSTLDEQDPLYRNQSRYERYELPLTAGQAVQIDMEALPASDAAAQESPDALVGFDTYLELHRVGTVEPLMINDDRPDSLNSRIVFTAPDTATYTITASSFGASNGRYVLRVAAVGAPEGAEEITGDRVTVRFPPPEASSFPRTSAYFIQGRANERLRLTIPASATSTYLELTNRQGVPIASSWSLDGQVTQLVAILPAAGRYDLSIATDSTDPAAGVELAVQRALPAAAEQVERIRREVPVDRALGLDAPSAIFDEGGGQSFFRLFEVETDGSKPVVVTVEALGPDVDPVVDIVERPATTFENAFTDDDSGGNLNSRLVIRPPHASRLLIRVRFFNLAVGNFRLAVSQPSHTQRVFVHFAGTITRESIIGLVTELRATGWQVQGDNGQRIGAAAGYNEVRYSADSDARAAEVLADELTRAQLGNAPVRTRRLGIVRPGVLEVWISN